MQYKFLQSRGALGEASLESAALNAMRVDRKQRVVDDRLRRKIDAAVLRLVPAAGTQLHLHPDRFQQPVVSAPPALPDNGAPEGSS